MVVACPACGATDAVAISSATGFPTFIGEKAFEQPDYDIMECRHCGLLYKSATLSPERLGEYYSLVDFGKWESDQLFPTELLVAKILEAAPAGAKILDFGCSTGRLLSRFVNRHQTFGFEVNERSAREAAAKGIHILNAQHFEALTEASFDFVIVIDVFEHLDHPTQLLRKLARLLRAGGRLIIVTGFGDAAICRFDPAQFWYFRLVEHLSMLTRKHLTWLESNLGLQLESSRRVSHYDRSSSETIHQWIRQIAYWIPRTRATRRSMPVLRSIPYFRKAETWECAPQLDVTRDHAVAVFQKPE